MSASVPINGFGDPFLPTRVATAPTGSAWVHEIKHDRYRLMVRRVAESVRIKTRRGFDWADRFPLIVAAAERLRASSFVLDGEGVILRRIASPTSRAARRRHDCEMAVQRSCR